MDVLIQNHSSKGDKSGLQDKSAGVWKDCSEFLSFSISEYDFTIYSSP